MFFNPSRCIAISLRLNRCLFKSYSISSASLAARKYRDVGRIAPHAHDVLPEFPELKHLVKDSKLEKLRRKDGVSTSEMLVYRAPNGTRLVVTYATVQILGIVLLGLCGHYVYIHAADLLSSFADIDVDPLPAAFCTCLFSLVVLLSTRGILRRSPLRIYMNRQTSEFTMVKLSMFLRRQQIKFTSADVHCITNAGYFLSLYKGSAKIGNCYYYLDPECFAKPVYYNLLMGKSWEGFDADNLLTSKK